VDDSCISAFQELKSRRDISTVIYRLSDSLETVIPDFEGNLTHDELLKALPAGGDSARAAPRGLTGELSP
jgi:cofilin